jgi:hypothetical protein
MDSQLSNCLLCNKQFKQSRNKLKQFCCTQHKRQFRRDKTAKVNKQCLECKVSFITTRSDQLFCNKKCACLNADNKRYKEDVNYKLAKIIRSRLYSALTDNKTGTIKNLGCSVDELRIYLESKFEPWMTWDNHGNYDKNKDTWQIDHILRLADFDLENEEELRKASHFSNLRPLLTIDNIMLGQNKRSSYDDRW